VERRKVQVVLWAVLFILQTFLAVVLMFLLAVQTRIDPTQLQSFDLSKTYSSRLAEKGQLTADDQRKLLELSKDYEKKIASHLGFEASMINEMRGLYWQLLLFLGIVVAVQTILATLSMRKSSEQ
jgi:hypothetical protein